MRRKAGGPPARTRAGSTSAGSSTFSSCESESSAPSRAPKRRKTSAAGSKGISDVYRQLLQDNGGVDGRGAKAFEPALPPIRAHTLSYHRPILLDAQRGKQARNNLLQWFDSVSKSRAMPWRKPWINPKEWTDDGKLRSALEKRAYEVWISEIMLQQTRVAAVIDYWSKWMQKWPTIQNLAQASPDDVLAAWRGLGYYSRATRIHEAAKQVVNDPDMNGLLPSTAANLAAKIPGVGRYTAGAISSIAFGLPAPMVDGNVLRVLSRQLGIHGNIKTDKSVIDMIWLAAEELVNTVAKDGLADTDTSPLTTEATDGPGRWGQGLMELGSTICTPKPNCADCPITETCRAYSEGFALAKKATPDRSQQDMEDMCTVCEPFDYSDDTEKQPPAPAAKKGGKQSTLAAFMSTKTPTKGRINGNAESKGPSKPDMEAIVSHSRKFPVKVAKKAVREEETLVCAIYRSDEQYLIHRRPPKGLLAGLWELPSYMLENPKETTSTERKRLAQKFVKDLLEADGGDGHDVGLEYIGDLGTVPWLFSHIKLTMHVYAFKLDAPAGERAANGEKSRWTASVDAESMGTGMRKCLDLVKVACR